MFILPDTYWSVRSTDKKGRGVYAQKPIDPGIVIGDYIGKIIRPEEDDDGTIGIYGMSAHDTFIIYPAVEEVGLHCINHSCMPNSGMYPYKGHILFTTLRKIFPGEEITVSYMVEPPTEKVGPQYPCVCGTPLCHGTMIVSSERGDAFWNGFVKKKMGKFYNQLPAAFGEVLLPFKTYPHHVRDYDIYDLFGSMEQPPFETKTASSSTIHDIRSLIRSSGQRLLDTTKKELIVGIYSGFVISSPQ